jgi:hypothetical protein
MLEKSESSCIIYSTVKRKKVFSKQQFLSKKFKSISEKLIFIKGSRVIYICTEKI